MSNTTILQLSDLITELKAEVDCACRVIVAQEVEIEELKAEVETLKAQNAALRIRLHHAYAAQRDTEPMP